MNTGNPLPITPLAVVEGADTDLESELHERFVAHHVRGEWFHDVPSIRDWFEANGKRVVDDLISDKRRGAIYIRPHNKRVVVIPPPDDT